MLQRLLALSVVLALPAYSLLPAGDPAAEPPPGLEATARTPATRSGAVVDTLVASIDAGTGGLSVGADGTVYSSDFGATLGNPGALGTRVWAITPAGRVSVFAEGFHGASGSAIDPNGVFYQSNIRGGSISRVGPEGEVERFVSDGIEGPVGIELDPDGNLYVANCNSASIQRVTPDGQSTRFAEDELLACPNGITRGDDGELYVANFSNGDVLRITPDGAVSRLATLPGDNNGHLVFHDGGLYVVGRGAHRIFRMELDGTFAPFAGTGERGADDGPADRATFSHPNDIGVAPDGRVLYVNEPVPLDRPHTVLSPTRVRRIALGG